MGFEQTVDNAVNGFAIWALLSYLQLKQKGGYKKRNMIYLFLQVKYNSISKEQTKTTIELVYAKAVGCNKKDLMRELAYI